MALVVFEPSVSRFCTFTMTTKLGYQFLRCSLKWPILQIGTPRLKVNNNTRILISRSF